MLELNKIYQGDCLEIMKSIDDKSIDLTVTSPPYDNLRNYNGYTFDFENIAKELFRVTKIGGVVVWIVGDTTVSGSETGTSFKQALYFKNLGFNLHDTMIYQKGGYPFPSKNRYNPVFEYMFILSKNKPQTFNPIKDRENSRSGVQKKYIWERQKNGKVSKKVKSVLIREFDMRHNVWYCPVGFMKSSKDKIAYNHPAIFPEQLANDHIISWSNENDTVLDPMCGSGTTCKMALKNNRSYIGMDISQEYVDIANKRIADFKQQLVMI